jgi:hypothetical protein
MPKAENANKKLRRINPGRQDSKEKGKTHRQLFSFNLLLLPCLGLTGAFEDDLHKERMAAERLR